MTNETEFPSRAHHLQRILVGVDGSDPSVAAADWAAGLAQRTDAEVVLIDVIDRPYSEIDPDDDLALRQETRRQLKLDGDPLDGAEIVVTEDDDPIARLAAAARSTDLLVIGSREHEGFGRHGFFSLAHSLAHHAPCPMVVIPPGSAALQSAPRIVIGIDGSAGNKAAFGWTLGLAGAIGAQVTAVFVTNPVYDTFDAEGSYGPEEVAARHEADAAPSVTYIEDDGVDVAERLRQIALDDRADLLVVGARSRRALGGLLLGKTPDELLHRPICPTVIVPHGFAGDDGT